MAGYWTYGSRYICFRTDPDGQRTPRYELVAQVPEPSSATQYSETGNWGARADQITRVMNAHDDLVAALEAARGWLSGWGSAESQLAVIDDALAKAKCEPIAPSVDPALHASTSPGPVNCNTVLRLQHPSVPRPRTCMRCGLGPCPFFDKDGNSLRKGGTQ